MPFDPDAYLASKANSAAPSAPPAFDPDKYLASKGQQAQPSGPSQAQAAIEHFGQGATAGYLPNIQAAAGKAVEAITPESDVDTKLKSQGFNIKPGEQSYTQIRDANQQRLDQEAKAYPKTAAASGLAGGVAGAAALGSALPSAEAGAGLLTRAGYAAAGGATQGLIQNPGNIPGQITPLQGQERLENARNGMFLGAGAEAAAGTLRGAAGKLKEFAQQRAVKQAGGMLKDFRSMYGKDELGTVGQGILDQGLVKAGDTFEDVATKAQALKKQTGEKLGALYDDLAEKTGLISKASSPELNKEALTQQLSQVVREPNVMPTLGQDKYTQAMDSMIQDIVGRGDTSNPKYLQDIIGELDNKINWSKRVPEMSELQQGLVSLRRTLRDRVNHIADTAAESGEEGSSQLKDLNKLYGLSSKVSSMAADKVARETANRMPSPSDYAMGAAGALGGAMLPGDTTERLQHAAEGAALGLVNKAGRQYGSGIAASGANLASQAASHLPSLPNPTTMGLLAPQVLKRGKK